MSLENNILDRTFQLVRNIGEGASGKVYEAILIRDWHDLPAFTRLAIKFYKSEILEREGSRVAVKRRIREAMMQDKIDHPNVVRIYDTREFWTNDSAPYLAMELLDGKSLENWIRHIGIPPSETTIQIARQLASGLLALHKAGILHRDIKPANIQISSNGIAIILDLGVCHLFEDETLTTTQSFLGTLRYAAPEWLFAEECAEKSDIYSLGTVFYLLLTGKDIFSDIKLYSRLVMAVKETRAKLNLINEKHEIAFLGDIVQMMLEKEPSKRPNLSQIIDYLENMQGSPLWIDILDQRALKMFGFSTKNLKKWGQLIQLIPMGDILRILSEYNAIAAYSNPEVVLLIKPSTPNQLMEGYMSLHPLERIQWVKKVLHDSDDTLFGDAIEFRWDVANMIGKVEQDKSVLKEINSDLEYAESAFSEMIADIARENPSS